MKMHLIKKQRMLGLSLVELMIAIALGSFLSVGALQLYVSHRLTFNNTEGVAQMQDNTRYALNLISKHARMAGYTGCISRDKEGDDFDGDGEDDSVENLLNDGYDSLIYNFGEAITGYDDLSASLPADLATILTGDPAPQEDTDLLILRGASDANVAITDNNNAAQFFAEVNSRESGACSDGSERVSGLCAEDVVIATDCSKSVVFQITNLQVVGGGTEMNVVHSQAAMTPGNSQSSWGGNSDNDMIGEGGEIIKMETNMYFIADNNGRPALYRKVNSDAAVAVADNVVDMQILYGEDTDTDSDYEVDVYRVASAVADWDKVLSVRLNLLVASDNDNIVGDLDGNARMSVPFNGETFTATDRRLYRAAAVTVVLRNRAQ